MRPMRAAIPTHARWFRRQELVNFPRPEIAPALYDAFHRASADQPALPESTPNPSLPDHMKLKTNNGALVTGKTRVPQAHRYGRRHR